MAPEEASPERSFAESYATASVVSPRPDGCIARMMRKRNPSTLTAAVALLL
jgi:hypothetical protein